MRASFRRPTYRLADLHFVIVAQLAADASGEVVAIFIGFELDWDDVFCGCIKR
jgi:hypothetical protein